MLSQCFTYVKGGPSPIMNSPGAGGRSHGGKINPFNLAPSRIIISSRVVNFRLEAGGRRLWTAFGRAAAGCQSAAVLILSARVNSSLHLESRSRLSSDGARRRAFM